jgi:hypothetical protein
VRRRRLIVGALAVVAVVAIVWGLSRSTPDDGGATVPEARAGSDDGATDDDIADDDDAVEAALDLADPESAPGAVTVFLEIVDDTAHPVVGAEVARVRVTGPVVVGHTDRDGMLSFSDGDRHSVRVRALGFTDGVFSPPPSGDAKEIGWTITLKRDASAPRVGVVWSKDAPVGDALVIAVDAGDAPLARERTDAGGRFRIASGATKLFAAHQGYGAVAHPLDEKGAAPAHSITLELPAPAFLEGTVTDGAGAPITVGKVRATSKAIGRVLGDLARSARKNSSADGRSLYAEIAGLWGAQETTTLSEAGGFRIGPIASDHEIAVTASSGDLTPATVDGITASPGGTRAGLLLVLDESAFMTGTVTDRETGEPLAGAVVTVRRFQGVSDDQFGRAVTDSDGTYRAPIEPRARLTVQVTARGYLLLEEGGIETRRGDVVERDFALKRAPPRAKSWAREYTGIGTAIQAHADGVKVLDVFKGPASDILQKGDVIVRVDGEWIRGLPLQEIVERIKGEPGADVELTVKRPVEGQPGALEETDIVIARDRIEYQGR